MEHVKEPQGTAGRSEATLLHLTHCPPAIQMDAGSEQSVLATKAKVKTGKLLTQMVLCGSRAQP